jgi:hypothetical protein
MEAWRHLQPVVKPLIDRALSDGLGSLTNIEKNAYLVWCYPAAIGNGGHASFFYNSYGEFANETVDALLKTGLVEFSHILMRAIKQFPDAHVPRELDERNDAFNRLSDDAHDVLEKCDAAFFQRGDDDIFDRLWDYWRQCAA